MSVAPPPQLPSHLRSMQNPSSPVTTGQPVNSEQSPKGFEGKKRPLESSSYSEQNPVTKRQKPSSQTQMSVQHQSLQQHQQVLNSASNLVSRPDNVPPAAIDFSAMKNKVEWDEKKGKYFPATVRRQPQPTQQNVQPSSVFRISSGPSNNLYLKNMPANTAATAQQSSSATVRTITTVASATNATATAPFTPAPTRPITTYPTVPTPAASNTSVAASHSTGSMYQKTNRSIPSSVPTAAQQIAMGNITATTPVVGATAFASGSTSVVSASPIINSAEHLSSLLQPFSRPPPPPGSRPGESHTTASSPAMTMQHGVQQSVRQHQYATTTAQALPFTGFNQGSFPGNVMQRQQSSQFQGVPPPPPPYSQYMMSRGQPNNRANNISSRLPYECRVCKKLFSTNSHLNIHMRTHTGERPYPCVKCKKSFSTSSNLTQHMRTHTGEKPHHCKLCSKSFSRSSHLTQHMQTHTGLKPYCCMVCGKAFGRRFQLTQHMQNHTGEKPYRCSQCSSSFSTSSNLTVHMRIHTGEKPYQCEKCLKSFTRSSHLTRHMRTHTGEKPYKCDHPGCNKAFSTRGALTVHIRTHTGEEPYECKKCHKRFSQSSHLTVHMKTHTGTKPFTCKICNKKFSRNGVLNRHLLQVHSGKNKASVHKPLPTAPKGKLPEELNPPSSSKAAEYDEDIPSSDTATSRGGGIDTLNLVVAQQARAENGRKRGNSKAKSKGAKSKEAGGSTGKKSSSGKSATKKAKSKTNRSVRRSKRSKQEEQKQSSRSLKREEKKESGDESDDTIVDVHELSQDAANILTSMMTSAR
mmetsp:Transcript_12736/g.17792  ORF Transcript_12736/g.17792 Transcript_12736/m.17792 type:complete len:805 (+) Transcript_12736:96-2510(+)